MTRLGCVVQYGVISFSMLVKNGKDHKVILSWNISHKYIGTYWAKQHLLITFWKVGNIYFSGLMYLGCFNAPLFFYLVFLQNILETWGYMFTNAWTQEKEGWKIWLVNFQRWSFSYMQWNFMCICFYCTGQD